MARVTVEDCIKIIPNRFELSLIASNRAKAIACGAPTSIDKKDEKDTVVALREIGNELLDIEKIKENIKKEIKHEVHTRKMEELHHENKDKNPSDQDIMSALSEDTTANNEDEYDDQTIEEDEIDEDENNTEALFLEDNLKNIED